MILACFNFSFKLLNKFQGDVIECQCQSVEDLKAISGEIVMDGYG